MELRVYAVNLMQCENCNIETDDQFMTEAEKQGLVFTMKGFEKAFNLGEVSDEWVIKFLYNN